MAQKKRKKENQVPWGVFIGSGLMALAMIGFILVMALRTDELSTRADLEADRWQATYWKKPVPLQGPPPQSHAQLAKSLQPGQCALCHYTQYQDWRESLHSNAMGPGLVGQFPGMSFAGQAQCLTCHAPMSEQWDQLADGGGAWRQNAAFMPGLKAKGLVCAACHLRSHQRFGPTKSSDDASRQPRADMKNSPVDYGASAIIHGQPERTAFFGASEFCKGCHQHPSTSQLINGKTVENTYQEWLNSPYPKKGTTCQKCHMPNKRHLWKGIHDPEFTLGGVSITTQIKPKNPLTGDTVKASLAISNTGVGHAFPTYTTPAVFLRAAFLDESDSVIPGYFEEKLLQRRLDMSTSPWSEEFDTRVLPGQFATVTLEGKAPETARTLYLWVWVEPDNFYAGFYQSRLEGQGAFAGSEDLERAYQMTQESKYLLFGKKIALGERQ